MHKKYFITLFSLVAVNVFFGCANLQTTLPTTRFESSEVPGHLHARFTVGAGTAEDITITNDASLRPVVFNEYITQSAELLAKASLGLGERFEISVKGALPSSILTKGKFQFVGDPAANAKEGNFSITITAGIGDSYLGKSGDQNGTFGPGGYNWSAYVGTVIYDVGLIAGYRPSDRFIIYGGPFFSAYSLYGSINQAQSDNGLSPAQNYPLSGNGTSYGGNLGAQIYFGSKRKFSLILDLTAQSLQWPGIGAQGSMGGGALFEFML